MGFEHLRQLAESGNADSQVELAHAYLAPARFPGRGPTQPDIIQAVKWCAIAEATRASVAVPACLDVLAAASPWELSQGRQLANGWLDHGQSRGEPMVDIAPAASPLGLAQGRQAANDWLNHGQYGNEPMVRR